MWTFYCPCLCVYIYIRYVDIYIKFMTVSYLHEPPFAWRCSPPPCWGRRGRNGAPHKLPETQWRTFWIAMAMSTKRDLPTHTLLWSSEACMLLPSCARSSSWGLAVNSSRAGWVIWMRFWSKTHGITSWLLDLVCQISMQLTWMFSGMVRMEPQKYTYRTNEWFM